MDPRKPRAGPEGIPSQPLPRPGAVASQPSTSGPPGQGVQPWRPSPSFREQQQQQQQQQQPTALHSHTSSHPLPTGFAGSIDPHQQSLHPQDPRRARQQQQAQLLPPPLASVQQGLNGFHVSGAGQAADGPGPSYGQQGTHSSGLLGTRILVGAYVCMVKTRCMIDALLFMWIKLCLAGASISFCAEGRLDKFSHVGYPTQTEEKSCISHLTQAPWPNCTAQQLALLVHPPNMALLNGL